VSATYDADPISRREDVSVMIKRAEIFALAGMFMASATLSPGQFGTKHLSECRSGRRHPAGILCLPQGSAKELRYDPPYEDAAVESEPTFIFDSNHM